jgi:polyisoprenyl-phosphate glycosyltransferase
MKLSVVSPVYNEEACVPELCRQLLAVLPSAVDEFEIILVDDGSRDGSWEAISALSHRYPQIRGLRFSRNFGHHRAITAGLNHASGDWIVVMDSDLQDPPGAIPELLDKTREGYDVVVARRKNRQFHWLKNLNSRVFCYVFEYLTDTPYDSEAGVFRIMSRRVVKALAGLPEVDRFFPALVNWVGFRQSHIYVNHGKRFAGETKYPFRKQMALAVDAMLSFSDKPIISIVYLGVAVATLSLLYATYIVLRGLFGAPFSAAGYASIFTAVSFFGGLTIATLGLIGLYIGRIFRQVKARPVYILAEDTRPAAERKHSIQLIAAGGL